jgi:4-hydroxyproline epimerase
MKTIHVIDSHTGGEPTRTVIAGGPDLGSGPIAAQLATLRAEHDWLRCATVLEPRGSDVIVGALLCEPAGVIFFNNVGYLGMCGHGAIGVITTLAHMGRIAPGEHRLDTPAGPVSATLHANGEVTITNVLSYRFRAGVDVALENGNIVTGDIAWGGNWFFLVEEWPRSLLLSDVEALTAEAWRIRQALERSGITGTDGAVIDHIELSHGQRNFVLCPGKAYDRSPCGTGTSARLACLAADGKLAAGEEWIQESITGSVFRGWYAQEDDGVRPRITGRAYITAEATLLLDPADPFRHGIR